MAIRTTQKKVESKGRRGNITAEAREKGAISKSQRGIFNKYIKALQGRAVDKNREKIAEIEDVLTKGRHVRKAPVFKNGKRIGTYRTQDVTEDEVLGMIIAGKAPAGKTQTERPAR